MSGIGRRLSAALSISLAFSILASGCIRGPHRSAEHLGNLRYLEEHGHSMDEVRSASWVKPLVCTILAVLPPGLGLYIEGEIGNGLKTTFLCWLVYPLVTGPIAAYSAASYENECDLIAYGKTHGWFEDAPPPESVPGSPSGPDRAPADRAPSAETPTARAYCPTCGSRVSIDDAVCKQCERKLR